MTETETHTPSRAVAEHSAVVDTVGAALAPWMLQLPAEHRAAAAHARRVAAQEAAELTYMSAAEVAERTRRAADAAADVARRELLADRAGQRWAMWCGQVPAIYVDDRADAEQRRGEGADFWLSKLKPNQHAREITAWLADVGSGTLWLIGPTGTGKTHAAMAAGYAAAARGVHARYVSQLDYLMSLRPGHSDDPMRVRHRFSSTSLLILDDFGAETGDASQFVRQELLALLDERVNQGRRQIITTNADAESLANTFGDRIMDRLRAGAAALKFDGRSLRIARAPW